MIPAAILWTATWPPVIPLSSALTYTAYYCEENIWHLCREPMFAGLPCRVVIISNPGRCCAVWQQRAAPHRDLPICWDYHVVLAVFREPVWELWDMDTLLGMPAPAREWLSRSFLPLRQEYAMLAPRFRVLDRVAYVAGFSSDRSHMRDTDGSWRRPPPSWPTIEVAGRPSFLGWTEMAAHDPDCLDLDELRALFTAPPPPEG